PGYLGAPARASRPDRHASTACRGTAARHGYGGESGAHRPSLARERAEASAGARIPARDRPGRPGGGARETPERNRTESPRGKERRGSRDAPHHHVPRNVREARGRVQETQARPQDLDSRRDREGAPARRSARERRVRGGEAASGERRGAGPGAHEPARPRTASRDNRGG